MFGFYTKKMFDWPIENGRRKELTARTHTQNHNDKFGETCFSCSGELENLTLFSVFSPFVGIGDVAAVPAD